ncbi:NAD(P)-dependent oxidoreductase [Burkholderia thailandensis]|uniref:NAD(P)-dependent oxidoreductase n=1 Tax=Burkholderia thailandensis TaxID=57975 RepID=UPI00031D4106|nr:NAD(P)-dependent oxidoreductase [Burkholderia thailandensis]AIP62975.2 2-hydroxy-3-oxopropionate reductase [Burkholderia thailandensis]AOI51663.1 2-hydroxy-3-oxopropionate reductase [Burkholderia thailandensis]MCS3391623.1 NAD(P)-dependent oxidoreductase [Burkholderia thailandensis]MCS6424988.1 NAD(P)-dependent oxidoreductase [Burkholderia thailandensis]MCS6452721.1 NAD(P)-dependent oxidoreductase [Burkholderia thailandensis]
MMGGNFNRYSNERKGEDVDVGFCGPGLMGAPMIRHLLSAGHRVHVWNRTRAKADALAAHGAQVVDTPAELAARVQTVMLCVLDAQAVGDVVFGASGVLAGDAAARRVTRIVDHSSIPPAATRAYAARAAALGASWVDAPVSGGVPGAEAGTLAVMAGGAQADVDAVRGLIGAYASRVTHLGDAGAGQTAKLCNQAIVTASVTAIAEAVGLAQASGIDAARLAEALAGGWADSVLLQTFVPRMTSTGHPPIGALKTFQKDVDAIADAARDAGAVMPVAATVQQVLRLGAAMGLAQADFAAFIDIVRPQAKRGE